MLESYFYYGLPQNLHNQRRTLIIKLFHLIVTGNFGQVGGSFHAAEIGFIENTESGNVGCEVIFIP